MENVGRGMDLNDLTDTSFLSLISIIQILAMEIWEKLQGHLCQILIPVTTM